MELFSLAGALSNALASTLCGPLYNKFFIQWPALRTVRVAGWPQARRRRTDASARCPK